MRISTTSLLLLALLSACAQAPAPAELRVVDPSGAASRDATFDFGSVPRGSTKVLTLLVQNTGAAPLTLTGFELVQGTGVSALPGVESDAPRFSVTLDGDLVLPPGGQRGFPLSFSAPEDAQLGPSFEAVVTLRAAGPPAGLDAARVTLRGVAAAPTHCTLPDSLDFLGVARGDAFVRTLTITNSDDVPTTLVVDAPQGDAAFSVPRDTVTIAAGGSADLAVTFAPAVVGHATAELPLHLGGCPEHRVQLIGDGVEPVLTWAPTTLDFGYANVGASVEREVTFSNHGFTPVELTHLAVFEGSVPATAFALPPGMTTLTVPSATRGSDGVLVAGTATLRLRFTSSALGPRTGTLRATADVHNQAAIVVPLRGVGGGPDVTVSPLPELDLGRLGYFAGQSPLASATGHVTILNVGTPSLPVDPQWNLHLGVAGNAPYWEVTPLNANTSLDELCVGAYDAAARQCLNDLSQSAYDPNVGIAAGTAGLSLPVRAEPHGLGMKEWALKLFTDDLDEPVTTVIVRLNAVALPPCNLQVNPVALSFGLVAPGETKTLSVRVQNLGTQPSETCLLSNFAVEAGTLPPPSTATMFSLVDAPNQTLELPAGARREIVIRAAPRGTWLATPVLVNAALTFSVSNPASPVLRADVSATVGKGCLVVVPEAWDFGTVPQQCGSSVRDVAIYNDCASAVTVDAVDLALLQPLPAGTTACPGAQPCPEFTLSDVPAMPATLAAGGTLTGIHVQYRPLDVSEDQAVLRVRSTESGQMRESVVPLRGRGDLNGANTDAFTLPREADVLMVMDDSGTLYDKEMALRDVFDDFIRYANTKLTGYQFAVTTTDMGPYNGWLRAPSGVRFLTPSTAQPAQTFWDLIDVGFNGSATESCLEPASRALSWPLTSAPTNQGFVRPGATLGVICVTDAQDQAARPPWVLHELLRRIKGTQQPSLMTYNVIGPMLPSAPSGCIYDASGDDGRHAAAAAALHGITEEICTTDWPHVAERIGRIAFGQRDHFFLTSRPDVASTPQVLIDGVALPAAASSYDPVSNAVQLDVNYLPTPGQTVTVQYQAACLP